MLAGDLVDEETYRLCSFSEGNVRLQDVKGGSRTLLGEADVPGLRHGAVRLGLRSDGTTVGCLWNGRTVLAVSSLADRNGGIGIQVWHEKTGEARLHATQVSVETASRENAYPLLRAHIEPRRQEGHLPAFPNIVIPQEAAPAPSATVVVAPAPQDPLADRRASGNTETAGSGADERRWGAPQGDFFPRWRDRLDDLLGNLDAERGRRR